MGKFYNYLKGFFSMNYKLPNERKSKQIVFNCTEDFFKKFEQLCEKRDTTKSRLIRKLIEKEIENN